MANSRHSAHIYACACVCVFTAVRRYNTSLCVRVHVCAFLSLSLSLSYRPVSYSRSCDMHEDAGPRAYLSIKLICRNAKQSATRKLNCPSVERQPQLAVYSIVLVLVRAVGLGDQLMLQRVSDPDLN